LKQQFACFVNGSNSCCVRDSACSAAYKQQHQQLEFTWWVEHSSAHAASAKQYSCWWCLHVCLQSKTHVVLATLKRAQNDMSSYQRKMFKVDDHMGIAIAGLTADGRVLCKYMRNECINHR
jgi:hypothetical protein